MQLRSGAEWKVPETGKGRVLDIVLYDSDGIYHFGQEEWDKMTLPERAKRLQKLADTYVVVSMANEGALSKEYAAQRIKAIKEA